MMNKIRILLKTYYQAGGKQAVLGFVSEPDIDSLQTIPDNLLIVVIEELASVGMDHTATDLAGTDGRTADLFKKHLA